MAVKNICQIVFTFLAVVFMTQVIAETNTNSNTNAKSSKRDGCVGCPSDLDSNHEIVKLYIDKAFKKFAGEYPGDQSPMVVNVLHASQQVVAGIKYVIAVNIGPSNCTKSIEPPKNCVVLEGSPINKCTISAHVKSWENYEKVDIDCEGLSPSVVN